jgi:hypothetical protein
MLYDVLKNHALMSERGIGFEKIIMLIGEGKVLDLIEHPRKGKYPHQYLIQIDVDGYVYVVPCVIHKDKVFLKTIYPSRKATKQYLKEKVK